MSTADKFVFLFLLAITASIWLLGYYVFRRNRGSGSSRPFLIVTFFVGLWAILSLLSHVLFLSWPDGILSLHEAPVILDECTFFSVAFMGPAILHLILLNLGWNTSRILKRIYLLYLFSLVTVGTLLFEILTFTPIIHTSFLLENGVYTAVRGAFFYYFIVPYNYVMILTGLFLALWRVLRPRYAMERKNALIIFIAISAGFIANIIQIVSGGAELPLDATLVGFFFSTMIFAVAILKYGIFVIIPVREAKEEGREVDLPAGRLFYSHDETSAISLFSDFVKHGFYGMAFTNNQIEDFRVKSGLEKTAIFRFTESPVRDALNPTLEEHSELLLFILRDFVSKSPESVLYLQGLDHFLPEDKLTSSLNEISGIVLETENGRLIVVTDEGRSVPEGNWLLIGGSEEN